MNDPINQLFPWLILFLLLFVVVVIILFARKSRQVSTGLSIGAICMSFVLTLIFFKATGGAPLREELIANWLTIGNFQVDFGLRLDRLSTLMLLVVTGVASVIHIYSVRYIGGDPGFTRFFASMSLFSFAMLGIVLSNNFLQMFIFWELVGVSSYLLIGFWYERNAAADACKKAFITNRLGDFGFLLGIILIWGLLDGLNFSILEEELARNPGALGGWATVAGLLIFCGAVGKSAQFPLHVWLPDAMEGPTPVSALIHAATMVAAGVYMLCRIFFIFDVDALTVIAWVGGLTALLAGVIAVQQNDIKRILAFSTISQLAYMVMVVGLAAPGQAMFHLTTHAFFKALLFLGAGAVIYVLHHEQDIWRMGGLRKKMPLTFWTFLVGTLALSGIPPFSGFYSKDEILAAAYAHNPLLFALAVLVAALTALYMFRLIFVAFLGAPRTKECAEHAREAPDVMTWPLLILAVPSALAGFWGIEHYIGGHFGIEHVAQRGIVSAIFYPFFHAPASALFGLFAAVVGISAAYGLYAQAERDPLPEKLGEFARFIRNKFYFDEIYGALIAVTHELLARLVNAFDRWIVSGLVIRGLHGTTDLTGRALRLVQTGNLQTYAFLFVAGVVLLLYFALRR